MRRGKRGKGKVPPKSGLQQQILKIGGGKKNRGNQEETKIAVLRDKTSRGKETKV